MSEGEAGAANQNSVRNRVPHFTEPSSELSELSVPGSEPFRTVKEASSALGISERAVLKRIQQGTLEAKKDGKVWQVKLPAFGTAIPHFTEPSAELPELSVPGSEPVPNSDLLDQLRSENQFLRERVQIHEAEIERRDQAESELRRLMLHDRAELQELRQRLAIVAAPRIRRTGRA